MRRDVIVTVGSEWHPIPSASASNQDPKTQSIERVIWIPDGMTLAEGLRVVGGYTPQELDQIARAHPEKLERCRLFSLER